MALALIFPLDETVIYLDAVQVFSKSRRTRYSNHPVDKSASISDHGIKDNEVFNIRGLISSADFNNDFVDVFDPDGNLVTSELISPTNEVLINDLESVIDFLPGSVRNLLSTQNPTNINADPFRGYRHWLARERVNRAWKDMEEIIIADYDIDYNTGASVNIDLIADCYLEDLQDTEEPDTGDAFDFSITLKKIRFSYIKEVDVQITGSVSDASQKEVNKGDQTSEADTWVINRFDTIAEEQGLNRYLEQE